MAPLKKESNKHEARIAKRIAAKKKLFLKHVQKCGSFEAAARRSAIGIRTMRRWRSEDKQFAEAGDEARDACYAELKVTMLERAKRQSDTLAIFLSKAYWPDEFRDNPLRVEHLIRNDPQIIAMATAFVEILREFVPNELFQTAFFRFGAKVGMLTDQSQILDARVGAVAPAALAERNGARNGGPSSGQH